MTNIGVAKSLLLIGFHNWVTLGLSLRCKLRLVLKLSIVSLFPFEQGEAKVEVKCLTPVSGSGIMEVTDGIVVAVGANLPCAKLLDFVDYPGTVTTMYGVKARPHRARDACRDAKKKIKMERHSLSNSCFHLLHCVTQTSL